MQITVYIFNQKLKGELSKMIIIFGTKNKIKNLGMVGSYECSRCHNISDLQFMSSQQWFTLFWIPIFPISKKQEFMQCPICHQTYQAPK